MVEALTATVAMCTYNGARFVGQQLRSIAAQTRPPDELVVCDDHSADDTPRLVEQFAATAPFPVRLVVNATNLGIPRNFEQAIRLARSRIVFLSDQDDVWHPRKIQRVLDVFERRPEVGLVTCLAAAVDEDLNPLGYTSWDAYGITASQRRRIAEGDGLSAFLEFVAIDGATMAFPSRFRDLILPVPDNWWNDPWIATMLAAAAPTAVVNEALNSYRQHAAQRLGGRRKGLWQRYREAKQAVGAKYFADQIERYEVLRQRLASYAPSGSPVRPQALPRIAARLAFSRTRLRMRQRPLRRPGLVVRELCRGNYHRFAHGWQSAAMDLVV
jgi:glycosyltransferase involved in cell wall biosynthesis